MTTVTATPHTTSTSRISAREALELYHDGSIHELGRRAFALTERLHPEAYRTYVVDRNIKHAHYSTARRTCSRARARSVGSPSGQQP